MALGLEELGAVVALQGQPTWAARLVGAAAALREVAGSPPEPMNRTSCERGIVYARNQLGEKAFAKALAEGRTMTPEHAPQGHLWQDQRLFAQCRYPLRHRAPAAVTLALLFLLPLRLGSAQVLPVKRGPATGSPPIGDLTVLPSLGANTHSTSSMTIPSLIPGRCTPNPSLASFQRYLIPIPCSRDVL